MTLDSVLFSIPSALTALCSARFSIPFYPMHCSVLCSLFSVLCSLFSDLCVSALWLGCYLTQQLVNLRILCALTHFLSDALALKSVTSDCVKVFACFYWWTRCNWIEEEGKDFCMPLSTLQSPLFSALRSLFFALLSALHAFCPIVLCSLLSIF